MSARRELTGQLGRYRIVRKLGEGGMGEVYLADDTQIGRQVALKVPHFDNKTKPALIERFQREARLAASIDHPNLCAVHDVGEIDGVHYFTMPFIQGTPLSELIDENKPWLPAVAGGLLRKVALAVGKLHENGIVHRDLKPSNIMIRERGEPVLMDFGLARSFNSAQERLTTTGAAVGSPPYMSPEQVNGSAQFTPATDTYGLGVIYYELITGKLPFEAPNLLSLFNAILTVPVPPPSERRPGVDPRSDAFCLKALAKKPEERFPDAASLIAALGETLRQLNQPNQATAPLVPYRDAQTERSAQHLDASGEPRGVPHTIAPPADLERTTVFGAPAEPLRSSRRVPLLLLVALVLGAGLTFLVMRPDDKPPLLPPGVAANSDTHTIDLDGVQLEMVRVGKGKYWMGSPEDEKDREKDYEEQKEVTIAEDFYIGKYEVTQEQWEAVMGANPSYFSRNGLGKTNVEKVGDAELKLFPVEHVSWDNIQEFLKKLNEREKDRNSGWLYRLPREAEWEYSCRGGPFSSGEEKKTAPFYFAKPTSSLSSKEANFNGNFPYGGAGKGDYLERPCKVGSYKPNALGIYDMHGNVWEWCDDLFRGGPERVDRGGSWRINGQFCRAAYRNGGAPELRNLSLGFRLARVPSVAK